jgi:hypothetical protein
MLRMPVHLLQNRYGVRAVTANRKRWRYGTSKVHGINDLSASAFFATIQRQSKGITLLGAFAAIIGTIVAYSVQTRHEIASNKVLTDQEINKNREIFERDILLAKQTVELRSLKNLLLYGQSEEYRHMRKSFSGEGVDVVTTVTAEEE